MICSLFYRKNSGGVFFASPTSLVTANFFFLIIRVLYFINFLTFRVPKQKGILGRAGVAVWGL